jgi:hypothetical protein
MLWEQDTSFKRVVITNLEDIIRKQDVHINALRDSLGTAATLDSLEELLQLFADCPDIDVTRCSGGYPHRLWLVWQSFMGLGVVAVQSYAGLSTLRDESKSQLPSLQRSGTRANWWIHIGGRAPRNPAEPPKPFTPEELAYKAILVAQLASEKAEKKGQ